MALDFKCSADLKSVNAVHEEGQENKASQPVLSRQLHGAVKPSDWKFVCLRNKAKRDCPDATDRSKSSSLWKPLPDSEDRAWVSIRTKGWFSNPCVLVVVWFLMEFKLLPLCSSLQRSESHFYAEKEPQVNGGKIKDHAVSLKRKNESQSGAALSENAIPIGGLVTIPSRNSMYSLKTLPCFVWFWVCLLLLFVFFLFVFHLFMNT